MKMRGVKPEVAPPQPAAAAPRCAAQTNVGATPDEVSVQRFTLQAYVDRSPRMVAQRRALQQVFGPGFRHHADALDGESPLQGRWDPAQGGPIAVRSEAVDAPGTENEMPEQLRAGIESLSGMDLSDVRVHRNSDKPAQLNAAAYAQGSDIHLGPGQEKHLPHEAWHVVQQAEGRVAPTLRRPDGVPVNDDHTLESEANLMGAKALAMGSAAPRTSTTARSSAAERVVQGVFTKRTSDGREEDAPALEVLAAERRLRQAGIPTGPFRDIRTSEQRRNLQDFLREVEKARPEKTQEGPSVDVTEPVASGEAAMEDVVNLIDTSHAQPTAVVPPELITAYREDLRDDKRQFLQEAEGNAIANHLHVTAHVMNQVSGPLIQSNNIHYGNGGSQGYLLHIHGNHYIVIAQTDGPDAEYVDMEGNGYTEVCRTVADGNCLIDGLYIIRHGANANEEQISELRQVAAEGISDENIVATMSTILTDFANGTTPSGLGSRTLRMIQRDPVLQNLHVRSKDKRARKMRKKLLTAGVPKKRPGKTSLEDEVTKYVLECNRLGEKDVRDSEDFKELHVRWAAAHEGEKLPDHKTLTSWIEEREKRKKDYFGSDTESDSSDREESRDEDDRVLASAYEFTEEDEKLLERLNQEIAAAKTSENIETILRSKDYSRFVVPQYRGIAYMTNRFGKEKRREHRKSSQLGLPVFADAVRPDDVPREKFYTTEHGLDSAAVKKAQEFQKWLAEKRQPSPFVDPTRRAGTKKDASRVFPTPFHLLQSDYSEDYTKSGQTIEKYHSTPDVSMDPGRDIVYRGVPFRSHPFVSTADEARHAVRYALGNKPIAAEKGFRLRPRWRRSGKPQHPYSGKVYTSLHPLRDYLSPHAPSHVWSGRKVGALSINDHTSKEGESSFLAMIKSGRVALEQVIRWPSLTKEKDDSHEFGLSKEERQQYRKLLATTAPHSDEQRGMKSRTLGPKMEDFFVELVKRRAKAEAVRRNQKLIYRGLDGNFQAQPPEYVTPTKSKQNVWREPKKEKARRGMFDKIKLGKTPYGGLTEGYFKDWPSQEVYEELSDADDELGDDSYDRDERRERIARVEFLIASLRPIRDETLSALRHLRDNDRPAVTLGYRAAATRLARIAWRRSAAVAERFGVGAAIGEFPEDMVPGSMAVDDGADPVPSTADHIDRLTEALFDLTSNVLRGYISTERDDEADDPDRRRSSSSGT